MHLLRETDKKVKIAVLGAVAVLACSAVIATVSGMKSGDELPSDSTLSQSQLTWQDVSVTEPSNVYCDVSDIKDVTDCYGLYIDGTFVAACLTENEISTAVSSALSLKAAEYDVKGTPSLANNVELRQGEYKLDMIVSESALEAMLGVENGEYSFDAHTIDGTELNLLVSYTEEYTTDVTVAFSTLYYDNDGKPTSYKKTIQKGKDGLATEYYDVTYVNGAVVSRVLADTVYITEPTAKIIERGVKIGSSKTPTSLAIFEPPIDGYISSDYGWRVVFGEVGFHYGLDYCDHDVKGRPVTAGADGTVIYSQWHNGGYGYRVEILHSNGMITTYSHLSSLGVEVGDVVKTGDVLGIIGTTGKSTGIHVHFEVIIDGEKVDPELYVKKS